MTVTITPTLYGSRNPAVVMVTVTGLTGIAYFNVYRQAPGEPAVRIRGGVDAQPLSDVALMIDFAAPLNRAVTYFVQYLPVGSTAAGQTSAAPITVPFTPDGLAHHVLTDAITGDSIVCCLLADDDERTNAANATTLTAAGATYPAVLYSTRAADAGGLPLYTRSRAETLALKSFFMPGRPIVSRHDNDGCDVESSEYLYVFDTVRKRRSRGGDRYWTLPVQQIALPDPKLPITFVTLQDVADYYTGQTLTDLAADFATLLDVAQFDFGVV